LGLRLEHVVEESTYLMAARLGSSKRERKQDWRERERDRERERGSTREQEQSIIIYAL
jgi:hypothetical protein